jgi:hypothetical protein
LRAGAETPMQTKEKECLDLFSHGLEVPLLHSVNAN